MNVSKTKKWECGEEQHQSIILQALGKQIELFQKKLTKMIQSQMSGFRFNSNGASKEINECSGIWVEFYGK